MSHTITIRQQTIGEGAPKICVPLVGGTHAELTEEATFLTSLDVDLVEWRVDFFEMAEDIEKVKSVLIDLREILGDMPLIFTFRSAKEGGERELSSGSYSALNTAMIKTRLIDIVDIELFNEEQTVKSLIHIAQENGVYVILSNHDFKKTPTKTEMIGRLKKAQELGGDIPKIAVMPKNAGDVLTLLEATNEMKERYANRPIITMSMAGAGVISRLTGELFGSAITFGAAKKASAPGQIDIHELRSILNVIHKNL
ncbi:type I 3-dehydroquinate dehydratase [Oceanobacillus sp. FSL K6-2867]|uniref:type I 3-dehydroquinate dehydratase n=1 Tax=Oceanobacillus sp. FSL K6-2867 TaxID=2954748 RepID=UPI0030DAB4DD